MNQNNDSLSRLTLRQLRQKASELGVPLYSRKSKAKLLREVSLYQKKEETKRNLSAPFWRPFKKQHDQTNIDNSSNETKVVFLPKDPQWSYVFWDISELDRQNALSQGASRLSLRLSDVTGIGDGTAHRQTLQEVQVDSHATEWYLPIPLSDRDYRVELGYRTKNRWISLAFSSSARVPSLYPSDQILDQFVPFSLDTDYVAKQTDQDSKLTQYQGDNALHERLYQVATSHFRKTRIGSEEFQENRQEYQNLNDSGSGIWASGINESGLGGVAPVQRSFWLAADSELVLYGSTDPLAKLKIGGEEVPLASDGTFRLQVPFRDGTQEYPIEAKDSDGKQKRNITMKFERTTPVDNTNPAEQSQIEWF